MNDTAPSPSIAEQRTTPPDVVSEDPSEMEITKLKMERRFRLSGDGNASRALRTAIWTYLQHRNK